MRNRIILTAREKINRYGWRKFTIEDIASELGISKNTVYKYFKTKNEIISAVVDKNVEVEKADILRILGTEESWSDKLRALMGGLAPDRPAWVIEEIKRFFPQEWVKIEAAYDLRVAQISALFMKARENGEIRSDIALSIIIITMASTVEDLHKYRDLTHVDITLNQAMTEFNKILFTGILTEKYRDIKIGIDRFPRVGQTPVHKNENGYMGNKIIQVALEKINQDGFRKFTIHSIAAELGISKKTIYEYFASKNEIISAVVDTYVEQEKAGVLQAVKTEGNWSDKLQALLFSFAPDRPVWVTEELHRFFPKEWVKIEGQRNWRRPILAEVFEKAIKNGEIKADIVPEVIVLTLQCTFSMLFNYSNLERLNMTFNQAITEFAKILFTGILIK